MLPKSEIHLLLEKILQNTESYKMNRASGTDVLSLRVLSAAIFTLSKDALYAIEQNHTFTACSLTCLVIEAQIQLLCIDKLYNTKGKDYYEFAFVEQLHSLPINPDWQEKTLQRMKDYNCERFYNGKNANLSDIKSYHNHWYQSFAHKISDLSDIAFPHLKELLSYIRLNVLDEYKNFNVLHENYKTMCSFKHFSPFIVGNAFRVQSAFTEDSPKGYNIMVVNCLYIAVLSAILILNKHGENISLENCLPK